MEQLHLPILPTAREEFEATNTNPHAGAHAATQQSQLRLLPVLVIATLVMGVLALQLAQLQTAIATIPGSTFSDTASLNTCCLTSTTCSPTIATHTRTTTAAKTPTTEHDQRRKRAFSSPVARSMHSLPLLTKHPPPLPAKPRGYPKMFGSHRHDTPACCTLELCPNLTCNTHEFKWLPSSAPQPWRSTRL